MRRNRDSYQDDELGDLEDGLESHAEHEGEGDSRRRIYRIAQALSRLSREEIDQIDVNLRMKVNIEVDDPVPLRSPLATIMAKIGAEPRDGFYDSPAWIALRYRALVKFRGTCCCCGADRFSGAILQADHIKPRSKYPNLALDLSNIQVLCQRCNEGKSNVDETDWRTPGPRHKR